MSVCVPSVLCVLPWASVVLDSELIPLHSLAMPAKEEMAAPVAMFATAPTMASDRPTMYGVME